METAQFFAKFFPFIQTTARSEGTNALLKKGVGAKFSMTSFLREYQRILDTIHAAEDECDHNVAHKTVPHTKFLTNYYIERQAHDLYNLAIFRKFHPDEQSTGGGRRARGGAAGVGRTRKGGCRRCCR